MYTFTFRTFDRQHSKQCNVAQRSSATGITFASLPFTKKWYTPKFNTTKPTEQMEHVYHLYVSQRH